MKRQSWLTGFSIPLLCIATSPSAFAQRGSRIPVVLNYKFTPTAGKSVSMDAR